MGNASTSSNNSSAPVIRFTASVLSGSIGESLGFVISTFRDFVRHSELAAFFAAKTSGYKRKALVDYGASFGIIGKTEFFAHCRCSVLGNAVLNDNPDDLNSGSTSRSETAHKPASVKRIFDRLLSNYGLIEVLQY